MWKFLSDGVNYDSDSYQLVFDVAKPCTIRVGDVLSAPTNAFETELCDAKGTFDFNFFEVSKPIRLQVKTDELNVESTILSPNGKNLLSVTNSGEIHFDDKTKSTFSNHSTSQTQTFENKYKGHFKTHTIKIFNLTEENISYFLGDLHTSVVGTLPGNGSLGWKVTESRIPLVKTHHWFTFKNSRNEDKFSVGGYDDGKHTQQVAFGNREFYIKKDQNQFSVTSKLESGRSEGISLWQ